MGKVTLNGPVPDSMHEQLEDEGEFHPPSAMRVAKRTLVLASVACRGSIESDAGKPGAEELRRNILPWLAELRADIELEQRERELITQSLGKLDRKNAINATWKSEGLVVLAWALSFCELPSFSEQCDPPAVANGIGLLAPIHETCLRAPVLRERDDIKAWTDRYLTLHWRLRLLESNPGQMDFVDCVNRVTWGPLSLDGFDLIENDISVDDTRIDLISEKRRRDLIGIAQERHQAFNWLLGFDELYSHVTTDT
jgi:hypothetical protein